MVTILSIGCSTTNIRFTLVIVKNDIVTLKSDNFISKSTVVKDIVTYNANFSSLSISSHLADSNHHTSQMASWTTSISIQVLDLDQFHSF